MEAVRIADGDGDLTDANGARIAERRPGQRRSGESVDADDGEIGIGVAADQVGAHRPAVRQRHRETIAALDHVAVREDEAVGREHHAGAAAAVAVDLHDRGADRLDGADDGL